MSNLQTARMQEFRQRAFVAIEDVRLQDSLASATGGFVLARKNALNELPNSDELRDHFKRIRSATLGRLGEHLQTFERNAMAAGATVHWAQDGVEACQLVVEIAQRRGINSVATKSKSMATEEIGLNTALQSAGITPVETDLGEWIIQLADEAPSHIIAPAIHKTREQVADLFERETGMELSSADIPTLTEVARQTLREQFLSAGMGITGGNIAVAETGSLVLVTNEGNARLVTGAPPVHVAIIGIEKVVPTWDGAAVWLSLLARSATGQPLSVYTTVITGPAGLDDPDGPEEVHIILLDNGRSKLIGTPYEEVLQCIRCGACLNACPVYKKAGGHAYGSPYSGPIGAVISPLLFGKEAYQALPQASSLCGACRDVCPARIDLPHMLLALREEQVAQGMTNWSERLLENGVAELLKSEGRLNGVGRLGRLGQGVFRQDGWLKLPGRETPFPPLAKKPFRQLWQEGLADE